MQSQRVLHGTLLPFLHEGKQVGFYWEETLNKVHYHKSKTGVSRRIIYNREKFPRQRVCTQKVASS